MDVALPALGEPEQLALEVVKGGFSGATAVQVTGAQGIAPNVLGQ